jgi:hypothetical protein
MGFGPGTLAQPPSNLTIIIRSNHCGQAIYRLLKNVLKNELKRVIIFGIGISARKIVENPSGFPYIVWPRGFPKIFWECTLLPKFKHVSIHFSEHFSAGDIWPACSVTSFAETSDQQIRLDKHPMTHLESEIVYIIYTAGRPYIACRKMF